ncbi:hypothetical protein KI387_001821, partial [Taxus chinensis]
MLEQQVLGNEEEEEADNNNQPSPGENANVGVDNNNVNIHVQPENKKARLVVELTNDIKRISPPKFDGTTLGDGAKKWLRKMEKYFEIRNFSEETKEIWGAYQISHEASSCWDSRKFELKIDESNITWDQFKGLPPKRVFDFMIEIKPGIEPISKALYRMTTTKLLDLKAQLHEILSRVPDPNGDFMVVTDASGEILG